MFPLVPYHNLPKLHELVKADMPPPYRGLWQAWREIVPAVSRQVKDPGYYVRRKLPIPRRRADAPPPSQSLPSQRRTGRRLGRGVHQRILETRGRHPLRSRWTDLCHLPLRGGWALRHRWPLHSRQYPSRRGLGERPTHRMSQAQRTLRHHRRFAAAQTRLRGAPDLRSPGKRRQTFPPAYLRLGARAQTECLNLSSVLIGSAGYLLGSLRGQSMAIRRTAKPTKNNAPRLIRPL